VGQENHLAGENSRTGVWSNGRFAWVEDSVWEKHLDYLEDTLVTNVRLYHPYWKLEVTFNDTVDLDRALFLRRVTVVNRDAVPQEVRIFFHYDFHIYGIEVGDTILYAPTLQAMMAYKGRRYFLINVQGPGGTGIKNWAIGLTELQGREGTWRDAEDGHLEENPIAQGSVDGTVALSLGVVLPGGSTVGHQWLGVATSRTGVEELDQLVRERTPDNLIDRTRDWWLAWLHKQPADFGDLSPEAVGLYRRSLLTLRSQIDEAGAVIASTDWDILSFSRDTYAYCWPRDGALAAVGLDRAGYSELSRRFFGFCFRILDPLEGYFLHKFTPQGELASSWHPWLGPDKEPQLPIQEDETGLVLFALWRHYEITRDIEFIKPLYRPVVRGCADFMVKYLNRDTGLPLPSYDLWEERRGVHAFTIASVWAGLEAANNFARVFNQLRYAERYQQAAEGVRLAAIKHLWDPERGYFSRTLYPIGDSSYSRDSTLDVSLLALSLFGMLAPYDEKMKATVEVIHRRLWCQTEIGGLARYENDYYHQVSREITNVPGNPWFIGILWLAQYYISVASSRTELERARVLLQWVVKNAQPSRLLPEQVNPYDGQPLSVSPLTWSHAEYVNAVQDYSAAYNRLQ
jgi:oligosaccharide amylase